jgi:hypothetical protein
MAENKNETLYQVLGVRRNAKVTDLTRAYARILSDQKREDVPPNPKQVAMAKVAYETLSDPARREAYDATLPLISLPAPKVKARARRKSRAGLIAAAGAVVVIAAGAAWYFLDYRPAQRSSQRAPEKAHTGAEIAEMVSPYLGRMQGALIGESRDLGLVMAMAENEMVGACRDMPAGMVLALQVGAATPKAELVRANEELGICVYNVRGNASGLKVRGGTPAPGEPLYAIVREAGGPPRPLQVSVGRALADPKGPALEIKAGAPLTNGAPIFDAQARLVGLVVAPHAYGEGIVAALGGARIAASRPAAAQVAAPSAIPNAAGTGAPGAPPTSDAAPAAASGPRSGTKLGEGFTTLWKEAEDEDRRLIEVLDDTKKGYIGLPLAYWTKWTGRNPAIPQVTHCVVTYGADDEIVADYEQATIMHAPEGYWFCALTRFQVPLDDLPKGVYTFRIFVNGNEVSQASIPVERRFFTPTVKIILTLLAGFALLVWVGGRKKN